MPLENKMTLILDLELLVSNVFGSCGIFVKNRQLLAQEDKIKKLQLNVVVNMQGLFWK